jgi:hypothetical protein
MNNGFEDAVEKVRETLFGWGLAEYHRGWNDALAWKATGDATTGLSCPAHSVVTTCSPRPEETVPEATAEQRVRPAVSVPVSGEVKYYSCSLCGQLYTQPGWCVAFGPCSLKL